MLSHWRTLHPYGLATNSLPIVACFTLKSDQYTELSKTENKIQLSMSSAVLIESGDHELPINRLMKPWGILWRVFLCKQC